MNSMQLFLDVLFHGRKRQELKSLSEVPHRLPQGYEALQNTQIKEMSFAIDIFEILASKNLRRI